MHVHAVGDCARLVFGFGNLAKVISRKDDGVFVGSGVLGGIANIDEVGAERQVRTVLFNDAERQHAYPLSLMDRGDEVGAGEFFPFGREFACSLTEAGDGCGGEQAEGEVSHLQSRFS